MNDKHSMTNYPYFEDTHKSEGRSNFTHSSGMSNVPREFQNVLVYEPTGYNDVQSLIDFFKRKEPAIINLDSVDATTAQRVLDFASGAIYALNGSVMRITGNIFLFSPEGVGVTVPHDIS